jgi:tetratricopeptide (TPR) repeat protein
MKKNIFTFGMTLQILMAPSLFSQPEIWQTHWENGLKFSHEKNYDLAEKELDLAISIVEKNHDDKHPHLYVDRADAYYYQGKYQESVRDATKALESENLENSERCDALLTRMYAYCYLGLMDESVEDYNQYHSIYPFTPKFEWLEDKIIIRNSQSTPESIELLARTCIAVDICEKKSDITVLNSGVVIIKRKQKD